MMLAGGDMLQYETIKRMSIGDYLVKLTNYVDGIEREVKQHKAKNARSK